MSPCKMLLEMGDTVLGKTEKTGYTGCDIGQIAVTDLTSLRSLGMPKQG